MKHLDFGIGIEIPLAAATETFAIVAKRRVGKSNTAVVMAEAFYGVGVPFVAVDPKGDWYGVRADGPRLSGLKVVIFGGRHADVPLEATKPLTAVEVAALAGIAQKSSTFRTYKSLLRTKGYLVEHTDGRLAITDQGFAIVGPVAGPKTAQELYDHWARRLPSGAREMLRVIMEVYPHALERDELGRRTQIDPATSTYRTYMSLLRRRGLAQTDRTLVQASPALFEGGR